MVAAALLSLVLLTWAGTLIRNRSGLLQRLFIPGSLVAGLVGLLLGPEVAGRLVAGDGAWPTWMIEVWVELPGLLISAVFAALFLGKRIPTPREIWQLAGPQVAFGQTMAWGQYVVGLVLALLVLGPVFGMPAVSGTLIEIGFEGGHGTSAGMADAFAAVGFSEGTDLALGLATIGVLAAVLVGVAFVNWAHRSGRAETRPVRGDGINDASTEADARASSKADAAPHGDTEDAPLHLLYALAAICVSILAGWLLLAGLQLLEAALWIEHVTVAAYMPLFPFAMIGGIAVQVALMRAGKADAVDLSMVVAVRGLSLDLLIAAAVATLSLTAIAADLVPFLLLAIAGIAWSLIALVFLAPRMLPDWWVERAAADIGQSLGMTATGLMLLRVADPEDQSPALSAFGYKQLLFEPIVGGGLFTAASVPLVAAVGGWPVLALVTVMAAGWLVLGLRLFGTRRTIVA